MKQKTEAQFKKMMVEMAIKIAEADIQSTNVDMAPTPDNQTNKDVDRFEERFAKIKQSVSTIFNGINNSDEFEQVLAYMVDQFSNVTDSSKLIAIRKVLAAKSKK